MNVKFWLTLFRGGGVGFAIGGTLGMFAVHRNWGDVLQGYLCGLGFGAAIASWVLASVLKPKNPPTLKPKNPPTLYVPGTIIQPGESTAVELPPELSAFLERAEKAGKTISMQEGPIVDNGKGEFERLVSVMVDGDMVASLSVGWSGPGSNLSVGLKREKR